MIAKLHNDVERGSAMHVKRHNDVEKPSGVAAKL